jgi:ribose 5-phosphate isomerase B
MKIIIGADRYGFDLKNAIKDALTQHGYDVFDATPDKPALYQDAAKAVAGRVSNGEFERGIVLCGTGMGVSIIANKHKNVYAALCESVYTARRARVVNKTNVLCMGGMVVGHIMGADMALAWLEAEYLEGFDDEKKKRVSKEFDALVSFDA